MPVRARVSVEGTRHGRQRRRWRQDRRGQRPCCGFQNQAEAKEREAKASVAVVTIADKWATRNLSARMRDE